MALRSLIEEYLRDCSDWEENEAWRGTWRQWRDLRATSEHDRRELPTDLAAVRQLVYEGKRVAT